MDKKQSRVIVIGIAANVVLLTGPVAAYLLLRDSTLRGERETQELIKALMAATEEKDPLKKHVAQTEAAAWGVQIGLLQLTPEEQKKLDAKYKDKIAGLRARLETKEDSVKGAEHKAK